MNILTAAILALLLTSASALQAACPELAGSYTCQRKKDCDYSLNASQSMYGDGITAYAMTWRNCYKDTNGRTRFEKRQVLAFVANGMYHKDKNWRFKVNCSEGNTLQIHTTNGEYDVHATYNLTTDGKWKIKGTSKNLKTGKVENYTTICHPRSM